MSSFIEAGEAVLLILARMSSETARTTGTTVAGEVVNHGI